MVVDAVICLWLAALRMGGGGATWTSIWTCIMLGIFRLGSRLDIFELDLWLRLEVGRDLLSLHLPSLWFLFS